MWSYLLIHRRLILAVKCGGGDSMVALTSTIPEICLVVLQVPPFGNSLLRLFSLVSIYCPWASICCTARCIHNSGRAGLLNLLLTASRKQSLMIIRRTAVSHSWDSGESKQREGRLQSLLCFYSSGFEFMSRWCHSGWYLWVFHYKIIRTDVCGDEWE